MIKVQKGSLVVPDKGMSSGCYKLTDNGHAKQRFSLKPQHFPAMVIDDDRQEGINHSYRRMLLASGEIVGVTMLCLLFALRVVDVNDSRDEDV